MPAVPTPSTPEPRVRLGRRYTLALAASLACWAGLVGALVFLIYSRTTWLHQSDQANLREWLDESRVFRKTLPDLAGDYLALRESGLPGDLAKKTEEIREQMRDMTNPTRVYQGYLPLFADIFRLELSFPGTDWP